MPELVRQTCAYIPQEQETLETDEREQRCLPGPIWLQGVVAVQMYPVMAQMPAVRHYHAILQLQATGPFISSSVLTNTSTLTWTTKSQRM